LPGVDGATIVVVKPPPEDVVTGTDPPGPLTVTADLGVKNEPLTVIAAPGW
jgi:hypothetical protein